MRTPQRFPIPPGLDLLELREMAESLAREVGEMVADMRDHDVAVAHTKSTDTDVVTRADLAAEERIAQVLREWRPSDGLLGEEGASRPTASGITWVIDPIDGTVNYLYGRPEYAVSIAAVLGDPQDMLTWQPIVGCVHAPALGVTYRASLGGGAQRNGVELGQILGPESVSHALVGTGFAYDADVRAEQGRLVAHALREIRDIRRAGAGALDVCDVGGGRLDAHLEYGLNPWDVAAALLVAHEAGAAVRMTRPDESGRSVTLVTSEALVEPVLGLFSTRRTDWEQPAWCAR